MASTYKSYNIFISFDVPEGKSKYRTTPTYPPVMEYLHSDIFIIYDHLCAAALGFQG
jgi:hypothetical protein